MTPARTTSRRLVRTFGFAMAVAITTSACGSTVPRGSDELAARGGPDASGDGELGAGEAPGGSDVDSSTSGEGGGGTAGSGAGRSGGGGTATGPAGTSGGGGGGGSGTGDGETWPGGKIPIGPGAKGVSDSTVKVGLITFNYDAANAIRPQGGGGSLEVGQGATQDGANRAAVKFLNDTGGIAGRQVDPVVYNYNVANVATAAGRRQEQQSACAYWTEDNSVFAMSAWNMLEDIIIECATKSRTPMVAIGWQAQISAARFASVAPYWYAPHGLIANRRERGLAKFLVAHKFFGPGARVAVMYEDKPGTRDGVNRDLVPTLTAAGHAPVLKIAYPDILASNWQNYVVQLKDKTITHVVWATAMSPAPLTQMLRESESQGFRPKWGVASDATPTTHTDDSAVSPIQLRNMFGMGSHVLYDLNQATPESADGKACATALEKSGQSPLLGMAQCEFMLFLRAGLSRAPEASATGLATGVGRLATSYSGAYTVGGASQFGPKKHDGVSVVRPVAYDDACTCFKYSGPVQPLPD